MLNLEVLELVRQMVRQMDKWYFGDASTHADPVSMVIASYV